MYSEYAQLSMPRANVRVCFPEVMWNDALHSIARAAKSATYSTTDIDRRRRCIPRN